MKILRPLLSLFLLGMLVGCIQSEDPNAEADILSCVVEEVDASHITVQINDSEIGKYIVLIYTPSGTDLEHLTPTFTLTPGATIQPESGVTQDFTTPVEYTVTSEDKKWKKEYVVSVIDAPLPQEYSFEHLLKSKKPKFDTFVELDENDYVVMQWASGNGGFSIVNINAKPSDFPTSQSSGGVNGGMCAKLVTKSTGGLGASVGMPIAAGNLFIGQFDVKDAISSALTATKFGLPFTKQPIAIEGYYKYSPGEEFEENGIKKEGVIDEADIYGVFYESDDETETLNGENSLTSGNIIAIARPDKVDPVGEWTKFYYKFKFKEGKTIDPIKLANRVYKVALVFSSSRDGARFNGAVGSTLFIDEVKLIAKEAGNDKELTPSKR